MRPGTHAPEPRENPCRSILTLATVKYINTPFTQDGSTRMYSKMFCTNKNSQEGETNHIYVADITGKKKKKKKAYINIGEVEAEIFCYFLVCNCKVYNLIYQKR
ncbi:hypothetical protein POVWA2_008410 [Plasmodium ovale wallikeri]|uniref:Uncharacterized protein n=1 Tax=Plasmodium ovale wallikeri TaxID=864142 RepID=A0A1A8YJH6_PLAOA|nr:hypothetical protein POVWA1_008420 [Plasmodium ovale wallikeri]SBT32223.1 hypothetical protein POVWA2_008410 [Plasmodium ovale wallikeri]